VNRFFAFYFFNNLGDKKGEGEETVHQPEENLYKPEVE